MTESDLTALLSTRHSDDVFFAQVKNGPTYTASKLLILDGWAMKKSYSQPCITAYEIKVSRSDFARDTKWTLAMPLCNRFFWVCPTGLIQPDEVPKETGLLWASKNGKKLVTKKIAPHHEHDELAVARLVTYLLYSRTQERRYDGAAFWRDWLRQKDERKELGVACSKKMQEISARYIAETMVATACANKYETLLLKVEKREEYIKKMLQELEAAGLILLKRGDLESYKEEEIMWNFTAGARQYILLRRSMESIMHECLPNMRDAANTISKVFDMLVALEKKYGEGHEH